MRRQLGIASAAAFAVCTMTGSALCAEQAVVTALFSSGAAPYREVVEGFRALLQSREIPLLVYERDLSAETPEAFDEHLAQKTPDVVLALGTRAAQFCREHVSTVPVVFTMVLEVDSLAGGNRTGVSLNIPADKRLATLREVLPAASRIGVLHSAGSEATVRELSRVASRHGFSIVARVIGSQREFPGALAELMPSVDCLVMVPDPAVYIPSSVEHLLRTALESRVPVVGLSSMYTRAGALVSFDCDYRDIGTQAGTVAIRVLDGESPGAIRPLAPSTLSYSLNISVARQLGTTLPREVVSGAGALFGQ